MHSQPEICLITTDTLSVMDVVDEDVFDNAVQPALLEQFVNTANCILVAAVDNGVVIGMVTGMVHVHPDKPLSMFIIELGVSERWQRKGIGRRLLQTICHEARRRGCVSAWVPTEENNTTAREFYAACGGSEDVDRTIIYNFEL